ncbi:MAG: AAA family ATPase [Patescibacteria group bacterium]
MKQGIVIGKFYPPHLGHKFLIDTAQSGCDKLTVLVCDNPALKIGIDKRINWLKRIHPELEILAIPDILKDDDSKAWAEHTVQFLGYTPDVVFSSEDYGKTYAQYLKCKHILVDKKRINVPISGTAVREDVFQNWRLIHPIVRNDYVIKVCILGAESTGTTTLSQSLAKHFETNWVPEFGRMYSESLFFNSQFEWNTQDFEYIALQQNQLEDKLILNCNKVLFCDTNSFATSIWHHRYMGFYSNILESYFENRVYDLYILTGDEIPFEQDGFRDGEAIRHQMQLEFERKLIENKYNYILLSGDANYRLKAAINLIEKLMIDNKNLN